VSVAGETDDECQLMTWHGHDPAVSLSIYSDAQRDDLRAAGAAIFG
jgi:hypothetical protein